MSDATAQQELTQGQAPQASPAQGAANGQQPSRKQLDVAIKDIRENPDALRSVNRNGEGYMELVDSIRRVGVLKPINVREAKDRDDPNKTVYGLIDGLHRFTAAQDAGLTIIPAYVMTMDDGQVLEAQLMANVHKIETKPAEYSNQLLRMLGMNPTLTINELATRLAKSPKWLSDRLSITKLHEKIQGLINENKVNLSNAYALAKLKDHQEQLNFLDRAMTETPNVFVPLVTTRVKELNEAKRQGKTPGAEQFVPVPHVRRLRELEDELKSGNTAQVFKGQGKITSPDDFKAGIEWATHMDAASVEEAKVKWEAKKKEREAQKQAAKVERAKKQQEEANKILAQVGQQTGGASAPAAQPETAPAA
jgi:ParB/RepB/Spo0J family partition protein